MGYDQRSPQPELRQFGGLNTRDSEIGLPGEDSPDMMNVDLHPAGSIKARSGMTELVSPTGETKIEAIMRLENPEDNRGFLYCIASGVIYRTIEPGAWSWVEAKGPDVGSGPVSIPIPSVDGNYGWENARYNDGTTEFPACIYIARTDGAPLVAIGAVDPDEDLLEIPLGVYGDPAVPTLGTPGYPSDWDGDMGYPTHVRLVGLGRGSRLHAWGFPGDKNIAYYTALDEPGNFLRANVDEPALDPQPEIDGGFYAVRRGDGDELVTIVDMFSYTVIFKKKRTFIYVGEPGSFDWRLTAEFPIGCVSDRAWVKVGNDILFWAKDGPRALSAVQEYGDLAQANLSFKISGNAKSITPDSFDSICCYHDIENMRVIWFVPLAGSSHNDRCYVFYYDRKIWAQWDGRFSNMMDVLVVEPSGSQTERVIAGSFETGVVELQSGHSDIGYVDGSIEGFDIESEYVTNWIQTGSIADSTRALWLDVFFGDGGSGVDIQYQTDLNPEWIDITRVTKSIGGSGTSWGMFNWGDGSVWGATGRSFIRYEFDALFRLVRFRFSRSGHLGFETMAYRLEARERGARS